ncbi:type VI secretion system protein, partial [Pantoea agglomerans]|uniref:type VI secretion system protein n=1 Tax=Enterobacter agglomerans TaxID=549 RepID=UPI001F5CB275
PANRDNLLQKGGSSDKVKNFRDDKLNQLLVAISAEVDPANDLLRDLIFTESGLAGSNRRWEYRNQLFHWIGYGVLAGALL